MANCARSFLMRMYGSICDSRVTAALVVQFHWNEGFHLSVPARCLFTLPMPVTDLTHIKKS